MNGRASCCTSAPGMMGVHGRKGRQPSCFKHGSQLPLLSTKPPLTKLVQQGAAVSVRQLLQRAQGNCCLSAHGGGAAGGSGWCPPGEALLLSAGCNSWCWYCGLIAHGLWGNGRGCRPGAGQCHKSGHRVQEWAGCDHGNASKQPLLQLEEQGCEPSSAGRSSLRISARLPLSPSTCRSNTQRSLTCYRGSDSPAQDAS